MNYLWNVPLGFLLSETITDSTYNEFSTNNTKPAFKGQSEVLSGPTSCFRVTSWILLESYKNKTSIEWLFLCCIVADFGFVAYREDICALWPLMSISSVISTVTFTVFCTLNKRYDRNNLIMPSQALWNKKYHKQQNYTKSMPLGNCKESENIICMALYSTIRTLLDKWQRLLRDLTDIFCRYQIIHVALVGVFSFHIICFGEKSRTVLFCTLNWWDWYWQQYYLCLPVW